MQVRDVMTKNVEVIRPEDTLRDAAQKMKALDVGAMPVCDGERLVGMLTDRDITIRAAAEGLDPNQTTAQETMTPEVYYCFENQNIEDAALLMMEKQIRRLPIINNEKKLVGIVSLGDVAVETQDDELSGSTLEEISKSSKSKRE
jgi:CBS domain-containing protein